PELTLPLGIVDLSDLPEGDRDSQIRMRIREESVQPFDLAHGPLIRAGLMRLGASEHIVLVTMHHAVSDGWSVGILVRELSALYDSFRRGEPSPLPDLPIGYADYA